MKTLCIDVMFIVDVFGVFFIYICGPFDLRGLMVMPGNPALQDYLEFLEMM